MVKRCAYGLCQTDSRRLENGVFFIPFAKPKKDLEKCKIWINACNRDGFTHHRVTKDTYICSKHFVGSQGPTKEYPNPLFVNINTKTRNNRIRKILSDDSELIIIPLKACDNFSIQTSIASECFDTKMIYEAIKMPSEWCSLMVQNSVVFMKYLSSGKQIVINLEIKESLSTSLKVLDKTLDPSHPLLESHSQPQVVKNCTEVLEILTTLNEWNVCCGNNEEKFKDFLSNDAMRFSECELIYNSFGSIESLHHQDCLLLTKNERCEQCIILRKKLRSRYSYHLKPKPRIPNPSCNFRFMTAEQIENRAIAAYSNRISKTKNKHPAAKMKCKKSVTISTQTEEFSIV